MRGIVEVAVVHQELLSLIDTKVGGHILVLEGTRDSIECPQIILGHGLLVMSFGEAVVLKLGPIVGHVEVLDPGDTELRVPRRLFGQLEKLVNFF